MHDKVVWWSVQQWSGGRLGLGVLAWFRMGHELIMLLDNTDIPKVLDVTLESPLGFGCEPIARQLSERTAFSTLSITITSTGPRVASSFNPNCSCKAVKIDEPSEAPVWSGTHSNVKS